MSEQNPTPSDPSDEPPPQPEQPEQPYAQQPQQPQQPYAQQPYAQQPYAQQPYAQQPYAQQPQYYQQPYGPQNPTNTMAIVALVSGIAGLTVLFFVGSIVAVITGHSARKQIAQSGEEGSGMATAGVIMGWIGVGLGALSILAFVLFWVVFATAFGTSAYY